MSHVLLHKLPIICQSSDQFCSMFRQFITDRLQCYLQLSNVMRRLRIQLIDFLEHETIKHTRSTV